PPPYTMPIPLRARAEPVARAASRNFRSTAELDPAKTQTRSIVSLPQRFAAYKDLQSRACREERADEEARAGGIRRGGPGGARPARAPRRSRAGAGRLRSARARLLAASRAARRRRRLSQHVPVWSRQG